VAQAPRFRRRRLLSIPPAPLSTPFHSPTCPSLSPSLRPAPPARTPAGGAAGKAARTGAGAAKLQCTVCKTEVSATAPMKLLVEHTDSKHAKLADAVKVCFPTWVAPA